MQKKLLNKPSPPSYEFTGVVVETNVIYDCMHGTQRHMRIMLPDGSIAAGIPMPMKCEPGDIIGVQLRKL